MSVFKSVLVKIGLMRSCAPSEEGAKRFLSVKKKM